MSNCADTQHEPTAESMEATTAAHLAEMFKVLGDVTRVRILDAISIGERSVGELAHLLGLTESAVSHQLRLLRNMRLVRSRRSAQMVFYTLDDHHVVRLFAQGLEHVRERTGGVLPVAAPDPVRVSSPDLVQTLPEDR